MPLAVYARLPASDEPVAVTVVAGASGRGKSGLLNDLYRASKVSAAEYAARTAEAAAAAGARLAVETYTPGPQEQWAPRAPELELADVHTGAEVEVYIPLDNIWIPGALHAKPVLCPTTPADASRRTQDACWGCVRAVA